MNHHHQHPLPSSPRTRKETHMTTQASNEHQPAAPRQAGHDAALLVITSQANAGMRPDAIEASAEQVLADRFTHPTAAAEAFYREYDQTAASLVAELRDLDQPGTSHARRTGRDIDMEAGG
jgi:hypothetical protein